MYHHREIASGQTAGYCPAFDYLRLVLATAVAASHIGLLSWENAGNLPVQIFFALSGWLIGGILLKSSIDALPRFYFNRAVRIWIPYFVAVAIVIAVSLLRDSVTPKWIEFVFYEVTFVYNLFAPQQLAQFANAMPLQGSSHHFWSICSEEQFYLIAPIMITLISFGRKLWLWMALFVALMISPFWNYFGSISLGVLAAVLKERCGSWHNSKYAVALLLAIAVLLFAAIYSRILPYDGTASLLAVCIVLALAQPGKHSAFAEFLGGISYPMYLNHWLGAFAAHFVFAKLGMRDSLISQISSIVIAVAIASVLYVVIDRNIRAQRDSYFSKQRGQIIAGIGYAVVTIGLTIGIYLSFANN